MALNARFFHPPEKGNTMSAIPQIYLDHLDAVTGSDPAAIRQAWEPDGFLEFPYGASIGGPERLQGVEAIVDLFGGPPRFTDLTFSDMQAWAIAGGPDYVLEMHGSGTITATGASYEQDYIIRFGIADSGKLAWMREFWDPTRV